MGGKLDKLVLIDKIRLAVSTTYKLMLFRNKRMGYFSVWQCIFSISIFWNYLKGDCNLL